MRREALPPGLSSLLGITHASVKRAGQENRTVHNFNALCFRQLLVEHIDRLLLCAGLRGVDRFRGGRANTPTPGTKNTANKGEMASAGVPPNAAQPRSSPDACANLQSSFFNLQ